MNIRSKASSHNKTEEKTHIIFQTIKDINEEKFYQIFEKLIKADQVNIVNPDGLNIIQVILFIKAWLKKTANEQTNTDAIKKLDRMLEKALNHCDIDHHSYVGSTPLHTAAEVRDEAAVNMLIKKGANVENAFDQMGNNPLHSLCLMGQFDASKDVYSNIIKILFNAGIKFSQHNADRFTPLNCAATNPSTSALEVLIECIQDNHLETQAETTVDLTVSLFLATKHGFYSNLKCLLEFNNTKDLHLYSQNLIRVITETFYEKINHPNAILVFQSTAKVLFESNYPFSKSDFLILLIILKLMDEQMEKLLKAKSPVGNDEGLSNAMEVINLAAEEIQGYAYANAYNEAKVESYKKMLEEYQRRFNDAVSMQSEEIIQAYSTHNNTLPFIAEILKNFENEDSDEYLPLFADCALMNYSGALELLRKAIPYREYSNGVTPFISVVLLENGPRNMCTATLSILDVLYINANGENNIHRLLKTIATIINGNMTNTNNKCVTEVIKLLELRTNKNSALTKDGKSILHYPTTVEIIRAIADNTKVDDIINLRDQFGYTPLFVALRANRLDLVNELLVLGADITLLPPNETSLLDFLMKYDLHHIIPETLAEKGKSKTNKQQINIQEVEPNGNTILHTSAMHNSKESCTKLLRILPANFLFKKNQDNDTALHIAFSKGHVEISKLLLTLVDVKLAELLLIVNRNGKNVLHVAAELPANEKAILTLIDKLVFFGDFGSLKTLLKQQDQDGNTPLHILCYAGLTDVIQTILKLKDVQTLLSISNKQGKSVLDLINEHCDPQTQDILKTITLKPTPVTTTTTKKKRKKSKEISDQAEIKTNQDVMDETTVSAERPTMEEESIESEPDITTKASPANDLAFQETKATKPTKKTKLTKPAAKNKHKKMPTQTHSTSLTLFNTPLVSDVRSTTKPSPAKSEGQEKQDNIIFKPASKFGFNAAEIHRELTNICGKLLPCLKKPMEYTGIYLVGSQALQAFYRTQNIDLKCEDTDLLIVDLDDSKVQELNEVLAQIGRLHCTYRDGKLESVRIDFEEGQRVDITFTTSEAFKEKLKRRDFTMSSIAVKLPTSPGEQSQFVAYESSYTDAESKTIRACNEHPEDFFADNFKCKLRLIRLLARLEGHGAKIDPQTEDAVKDKSTSYALQKTKDNHISSLYIQVGKTLALTGIARGFAFLSKFNLLAQVNIAPEQIPYLFDNFRIREPYDSLSFRIQQLLAQKDKIKYEFKNGFEASEHYKLLESLVESILEAEAIHDIEAEMDVDPTMKKRTQGTLNMAYQIIACFIMAGINIKPHIKHTQRLQIGLSPG